ncbi:MAG TPA: ClpXP protease specificity-enhancing factor SspB [Kofleriaceae bacterium]|nr:ClpXP protease specificity-enhancing factor SspB [Kofleriaceae bacterium]
MSLTEEQRLARLQAVFTALLRHRLEDSLANVEMAVTRWRGGELGPFEAHAVLLKHVARSERLAVSIAQVGVDGAGAVLRTAFDAGLVSEPEFVELVGRLPAEVEPAPDLDEADLTPLPDKHDYVTEALEEGPVLVHIDARGEGVSVPERLRNDATLVLRFGHGLAPAIVDLDIDREALSGTLTFGGVPHHCIVPWPAVYAVVSEDSQRAMVWPDDVPSEVLEQMRAAGDRAAPSPTVEDTADEAKTSKRRAGHLKLVE